ncbi:MAG: helix-turn-helix transcriptional regulator [Alphaproteobacteria bacterium]|nr:helix-turn-helix transcriptional regulator [Alphaproteobacteria bacterium]
MVKYEEAGLTRTFSALADPTRRAILARLSDEGGRSVSELARPFGVTLPAILKHLAVLEDAGLIAREKTGRTVSCRLTAESMEDAVQWLNKYQRFWTRQLDRLAAFVEEDECPPSPKSNPASPSGAASPPRRQRSSRPGRSPKR